MRLLVGQSLLRLQGCGHEFKVTLAVYQTQPTLLTTQAFSSSMYTGLQDFVKDAIV